ncbi:MAG: AAA family ATPase, partial [Chitinophagales bacterium]
MHKVFVTGVSKFAKVSVFSGMNNAKDLTLMPELNDVVGLTKDDIVHYFDDYLTELELKYSFSRVEALSHIKHWYNGYSWDGENRIYNPFSIVHFFDRLEFQNFWYQSGTPTMLIKLIMEKAYQGIAPKKPTEYEQIQVTQTVFDTAEIDNINIEGLLFQTGYLTIVDKEGTSMPPFYTLDYPNHEVRWSFMAHILETYAQMPKREIEPGALRLKRALQQGNQDLFLKLLRSYFALIPYQLRK